LRFASKIGDAIKALIGKAVITSLDAWFCFSSSATDKKDALALWLKGQPFFIFAVDLLKLS